MISLKFFLHDERIDEACRTDIDEKLKHIQAFIRGLEKKEYNVELIPFGDFSAVRKKDEAINQLFKEKGVEAPPVLLIDGKLTCVGDYPSTDELADLLRIGCTYITDEDSSSCCTTTCCNTTIESIK